MKEKKKNLFYGIFLTLLPLILAFGVQLMVSGVGVGVFTLFMVVRAVLQGTELEIDKTTGLPINLYTEAQYGTFMTVVTVLSEIIMLVVAAIWYAKMKKEEAGIKKALKPATVVQALILGVGLQGVTSLLLSFMYSIFPESWLGIYDDLMGTMLDTSSPLMVISVAILAPIAEELFFRGMTIAYGRRFFPLPVVIIIQALGFGILHGNPVQITYATVLGLVLGLVAVEFKSVWPGVLVHIGVNSSAEVLTILGFELSVEVMSIAGALLCAVAVGWHFLGRRKLHS